MFTISQQEEKYVQWTFPELYIIIISLGKHPYLQNYEPCFISVHNIIFVN